MTNEADFDEILYMTPGHVTPGVKRDALKARLDLVPWQSLESVAHVLAHGAQKYGVDNWQRVENAEQRYFAAALRHLIAWQSGEKLDPESGKPHLAHAACCVLFMLWFEVQKNAK